MNIKYSGDIVHSLCNLLKIKFFLKKREEEEEGNCTFGVGFG